MNKDRARRIFSNLKPVYDVMGGDLVAACLEEGIPLDMLLEFMREWDFSEEAMMQVMSALPVDETAAKRIDDKEMRHFEAAHDEFGNLILNKKKDK